MRNILTQTLSQKLTVFLIFVGMTRSWTILEPVSIAINIIIGLINTGAIKKFAHGNRNF